MKHNHYMMAAILLSAVLTTIRPAVIPAAETITISEENTVSVSSSVSDPDASVSDASVSDTSVPDSSVSDSSETPETSDITEPEETAPVEVKPHWEKKKYVKSDGTYAVGACKIKGVYYIFGEDETLQTGKKVHLVKIGKRRFLANADGTAFHGWYVLGSRLYYTSICGRCKANTTYDGFTFGKYGIVKNTTTARVKAKTAAVKLYRKITDSSMTKKQKLKACWDYVTSHKNFSYAMKYPNLSAKYWTQSTAANMLSTHTGNCYSFACAFAALAEECGYHPYIVCGRVSGSRDGARDGLTRHSWVKIGNYYYDPEGKYAGWYTGCYHSSSYSIRHTIQKLVRYDKGK